MNKLAIFALICVAVSAAPIHEELKPIVEEINSQQTTWTAGVNPRHSEFTMDSLKAQLGALKENVHEKLENMVHEDTYSVPASFVAADQWPNCESIQEIRDQSACGSCWAFGAVEAMSDRLCIGSGQKDQTRLSAQDMNSCCSSCGNGCGGGYPSSAWSYYQNTGLVSGDLYGNNEWCAPYSMPPCAHHETSPDYPNCPSTEYNTPSCKKTCTSESGLSWSSDIKKGSSTYSVSGVSNIQTELMTNGPCEASMDVYADFETYRSGVYQHSTGSYLGGHAIKLLGWGTENGTPYWYLANSWNPSWGDNGYFKILRGSDECGIESGIVCGMPPKSDEFLA